MSIEKSKTEQNKWLLVRSDAEDALTIAKAKVRALKRSLRAVDEKIKNGDPFPEYLSSQSSGQKNLQPTNA